ncbi:hypothetical protein SAMN05421678_104342 [Actinopolymorpha cephalotaxi]|uniref:Uncharacterized protein n=1 Tax=Actinopolymorpha cephalotaxi TaxID=504797 RepID=A0A1I2Q6Z9_9ACTN|nr:hypothetical protein [Actinopolymorpha cephalotaxi]NYH83411.1 hypothetical protein [Actinopolymorpha cephalotaxi]SFG21586.1 hypothetical protein SAMN05421678_104342 [Actinopolymorpha cephalotaxi]
MSTMAMVPRSVLLSTWANSWLLGATSLDEADEAIRAGDAAHHVIGLPGQDEPVPLLLSLGTLRNLGTRAVSPALPVPGDPLGLAGPPDFTQAAIEAGEAVVCEGAGLGLVPHVIGAGVQWRVYAATPAPPEGFGDASLELAHTLQEVIDTLADLDVARWRPEMAEALIDLREVGSRSQDGLPPGYAPRAEALATRARRCLLVCELALADEGGSASAYEADSRRRALRRLEHASRRALVAACAPPR